MKDSALEQFYSRRAGGDTSGSGYDPLGFVSSFIFEITLIDHFSNFRIVCSGV